MMGARGMITGGIEGDKPLSARGKKEGENE